MNPSFHKQVQKDLNKALEHYYSITEELGDDFFVEFSVGIAKVVKNPRFYHFDSSGLRRFSLERFPYHCLYDIKGEEVRIWVLRHDSRRPEFGTRRFNRH